jgi:uncharacterized repeat protein (TIGR02543 family)
VYPDRITLQTPVRTGHTFEGWYTNANAGLSGDKAGDVLNAYAGSPANLYAKWKINTYTVTYYRNFDGNDNNVVSTTTNVPHGSTIIQMPPITVPRPGYVAKGWYPARSDGGKLSGEQTITVNTDFYIQWLGVGDSIPPNASGGETQYASNSAGGFDEVHIFKSSGTLKVSTAPAASKVSILLVAGGGGGGGGHRVPAILKENGGGGGAGGLLMYTDKSLAATAYTVTVGGGGAGGAGAVGDSAVTDNGSSGDDSSMNGYTAKGGGGGGGVPMMFKVGIAGGSGGGGRTGGGGTNGQGNSGGSVGVSGTAGGGGYSSAGTVITGDGAVGAAGGKGITTGSDSDLANKNATLQSIIGGLTGVPATYAVGGIGGGDKAGAENTGNGGAGGIYNNTNGGAGFAGGSGIVVVRFPYQYTGN